MINDKVRAGGICSMVLGIILLSYSGVRVGRRIDWAVNYIYGLYNTPYNQIMGEENTQGIDDDRSELEYVLDSLYTGLGGLALLFAGGTTAVVSRERIGPPLKGTTYQNLRRKGTRDNPYRL